MASRLPLSPFSPCLLCRASFQSNNLTSKTQVAYKYAVRNVNRKNSKTDVATIQMLRALPTYGDRGTYMQVPRGMMRQKLYPKGHARYIVGEELKELKSNGTKLERNRQFQADRLISSPLANMSSATMQQKQEAEERKAFADDLNQKMLEAVAAEEEAARAKAEEEAREVKRQEEFQKRQAAIARALPKLPNVIQPSYIFQRPVNTAAAQTDKAGVWKAGSPIFGSVTAAELLVKIREGLAKDKETAIITLEESNIVFLSRDDEADPTRLKSLGAYQVTVEIPGSEETISTTVEVLPDAASEDAGVQAREEAKKAARRVFAKETPGEAFGKRKEAEIATRSKTSADGSVKSKRSR